MTGTCVALWLAAIGAQVTPGTPDNGPALTIDPCVPVDERTVREVMDLEIRGARMLPTSVSVRCVDGAQEIRVLPWISPESEGIRAIQLPPVVDDDDAAARQARSRELALAIAEFIRRFDAARTPSPEPREPTPSPTPVPWVPAPATPATPASPPTLDSRWWLGLESAIEYFSRGQTLAGGDVLVASDLGRWFSADLRAGGRIGTNEPLPSGRLTTRAATAGVGVGFNLWSPRRPVVAALVLRAQGYLVQFRVEQVGNGHAPTVLLGALTLTAQPRLALRLTRRLFLEASAGVGFPVHGIVVRTRETETNGISGLTVSGSLGGVVSF